MATNHVRAKLLCPRCGGTHEHDIETMLDGQGEAHEEYRVGDVIDWLPGREREDGGRPTGGNLDTDGYVVCQVCGKDFFVVLTVRDDRLVQVAVDSSREGYVRP